MPSSPLFSSIERFVPSVSVDSSPQVPSTPNNSQIEKAANGKFHTLINYNFFIIRESHTLKCLFIKIFRRWVGRCFRRPWFERKFSSVARRNPSRTWGDWGTGAYLNLYSSIKAQISVEWIWKQKAIFKGIPTLNFCFLHYLSLN